jgi:hypothetical protein
MRREVTPVGEALVNPHPFHCGTLGDLTLICVNGPFRQTLPQ